MKILNISPSLHLGGGEKFAVELCNELALNVNNEVYLCILGSIDNSLILSSQVSKNVTLLSLNKKTGFSPKIFYQIYKIIKEINPDVIHTHLRALQYTALSVFLCKQPFVHTFHTLAEKEASFMLKIFMYNILFNNLSVVPVAISDKVMTSIQNLFGTHHNTLVYNGVKQLTTSGMFKEVSSEISQMKKNKDTLVLLSVGRVTEVKNNLMLIESVKELNKNGIDTLLLFLGSLSDEKEYANSCLESVKHIDNMVFLDEKSNVGDYVYCADIICITSLYEGLPLVLLEAMSIGKNVVSTPVGGIPDVISDGINGFLSEDVSTESFVKALTRCIDKPITNSSLIKDKYESKFSLKICMSSYYDLYHSLSERVHI